MLTVVLFLDGMIIIFFFILTRLYKFSAMNMDNF